MSETTRTTIYLLDDDRERLARLKADYGLGTSAATRAGLALLERNMTGAQDMDKDKLAIEVKFSDAGLWGDTDPDANGYDTAASAAAFAEHLENFLVDAYPDADITVSHGLNDRVEIDGDTAGQEVPWVEDIVEKVWTNQPWNIEAG